MVLRGDKFLHLSLVSGGLVGDAPDMGFGPVAGSFYEDVPPFQLVGAPVYPRVERFKPGVPQD
jgi:hypothetical protein